MLAGKRSFDGEDMTDTIAAVVRGEPEWSALPSDVPPQITLLLKRCLDKDRRRRVSDMSTARFLMTETMAAPAAVAIDAGSFARGLQPRSRRRVVAGAGIGLTTVLVLLALAVWVGTKLIPERVTQPVRFTIVPPPTQPLSILGFDRDVVIASDGTHIVYRVRDGTQSRLVVRALNELDARPLAGNFDIAWEPFMSPDGRWIGFFALGELRKVSVTGGPPITICSVPEVPLGASWGPDDTIVFAVRGTGGPRSGLLSVSAGGGEPKVLTITDRGKGEALNAFPFVLPGGRAVLFTILPATGPVGGVNAQVAVLDLKTGQRKTLVRAGSDAVYVDVSTRSGQAPSGSGYLVYAAAGTLLAARFDLARLEVLSDPVPVVEHVMTASTGEANFSVSRQGTLVYVPGGAATSQTASPRSLVWVNRQGREEPIQAPPRPYAVARLSPDGSRGALDVRGPT